MPIADNYPMPLNPAALLARREKLGMTQQAVADAAKMPQPEYARLEKGHRPDPRLSTAESVARALRCKVDDLLVQRRR